MHLANRGNLRASLLLAFAAASFAVAQEPSVTDEEIERCLAEGKFLKGAETLVGVTKPLKVKIECDLGIRSAKFTAIDQHRRGITRLQGGGAEMNFSDDYRYERAAYLLDRELGLGMVPVAVLRSRKGDDGVVVDWIENTTHGDKLPGQPTGPKMAELARQKKLMHLFDALIENTDRSTSNWLIQKESWKVYLIDHTRAFRTENELEPEFLEQPVRLTQEIYTRLQELDRTELEDLLTDLLDGNQIEALIARRDALVEKIERDRASMGDEAVFSN